MSYLPNFVPLDQNGDSDGRNRHDLIIDRMVDEWFSKGLDDSKVYFVEKDYYHTNANVNPEEAYLEGEVAGDFDIAVYDVEDQKLELKEVKGNKKVPSEMSEEERRERFQIVDDGHDQISRALEKIDRVETAYQVDIDVEAEVVVWSDIFEDSSYDSETLPNYQGLHTHTDEAYEQAKESEAFEALNQGLFDGSILENGEKIEER